MYVEEIEAASERNRISLDWLFFLALFLWCAARTFCVSCVGYEGYFTWDDMLNIKYACRLLLLLREVALLWNSIDAVCESTRGASVGGRYQALLKDGYIRTSLLSLPLFLLLYYTFRAYPNGLWPQYVVLFVFCARSIDFRKVARAAAIISGIVLAIVIGAALLGVIHNYYATLGHTGWCLGFTYPLYPPAIVMNLTLCALVCLRDERRQRQYLAYASLAVLNLVVFVLCRARIAFGSSELAILLCAAWAHPRIQRFLRHISPLLVASMVIVLLISVLTSVLYDGTGLLARVAELSTGRIQLGRVAFDRFAITPFGQEVPMQGAGNYVLEPETVSNPYFYIDNYFLQVLFKHGVVGLGAIVLGYTLASWRAWKKDDFAFLACIAATALFMFFDDHSYYLQCNALVLALWPLAGMEAKTIINKTCDQTHPGEKE